MRKENDANKTNGHESKIIPITAARERFDPNRPAHIVDIVDKAMAEIYDQKSPTGPIDVCGSITRACEEAFRKGLRLSENELAKQLADAEEERDGMLILWGSCGGLDVESATRLRRRIATFKEALAMTDKVIEESITGAEFE
jgi:hypothetical protein